MSELSEEEIIKTIENILLHAETQLLDYEALAIQGLLDLYQKEKEKNKLLIEGKFREVADKNSYIKDNYISKDKIKEKIEEIDIEISQCEYADEDTKEYKEDVEQDKLLLLRDKHILQELLEERN